MCGIAGILNLAGRLSPGEMAETAVRMAARLEHRGPDDLGIWHDEENYCSLIHRRLSIIDLSTGGHQPMQSDNGTIITFNGEIYNYKELRNTFLDAGEFFESQSDTEVLLRGLDLKGTDFLTHLDAMFAFGHYQPAKRTLLLARDPFGEKPIYYTFQNGIFAFASELSALAALPGFDATVDVDDIAFMLALQYVPAPRSIYKKCRKLPPGAFMRVTPYGPGEPRHYFQIGFGGEVTSSRSLDDAADELEDILTRSLRRRLISDVPVGAFLSGGLDSSVVVALAAKKLNRSIDTFTIGFTDNPASEHNEARAISRHLGTQHCEKLVSPGQLALLSSIAARIDEPLGDTSCLPTFLLSELARQKVTVALTGDGGDELFGGYARYTNCLQAGIGKSADIAARRWHLGRQYVSGNILVFADPDLKRLFGFMPDAIADKLMELRRTIDLDARPWVSRFRQVDVRDYLPGAVLAKVDRMSMQHGLETRTPYLSVEMAGFAAQLPANKVHDGNRGKLVLRQLAARYLPADVLDRPKKGFGLPETGWAVDKLAQYTQTLVGAPNSRLSGWIDPKQIQKYFETPSSGVMIYQYWSLIMMEVWLRSHPAIPASTAAHPSR
jgi:asparagine synthase (glutamine-hydrolysing)